LDKCLGLRPRNEHSVTHEKVETPKLLAPKDVSQRLMISTSLYERVEVGSGFGFEVRCFGRELSSCDTHRLGQQQSSAPPRRVDARFEKTGACVFHGFARIHMPCSISDRRVAWSSVMSASMMSPKSSPAMILSSL